MIRSAIHLAFQPTKLPSARASGSTGWCEERRPILLLLPARVARCGLHRPLLYETTSYGYRVQPDQQLQRFDNRISYNSFGFQEPVTALRPG
jgi:hypothetical protein